MTEPRVYDHIQELIDQEGNGRIDMSNKKNITILELSNCINYHPEKIFDEFVKLGCFLNLGMPIDKKFVKKLHKKSNLEFEFINN